MSTRLHITVDESLLRRIDERRGLASRSAWIRDVIERACLGVNVTVQAGPVLDAVARSADQAERSVPADPEQFQRTVDAQAEAAERQERSRAQARQPKVPPERWEGQGTEGEVERPSRPPKTTEQVEGVAKRVVPELEARLKDEDLKRASAFVKDSAMMERQRKLNEGKG